MVLELSVGLEFWKMHDGVEFLVPPVNFFFSFFSRLDYAGIALLIVGSVIPWLYYGFYCQFHIKLSYIIAVSVCGVATLVLMLLEKFNRPEYR